MGRSTYRTRRIAAPAELQYDCRGFARMKKLALLFCLMATPAWPQALPPDLARAVRAYDLAQTRNDTATLSRLVTNDFVLVNSNATVEDKRQFLADFHLPGFRIEPYVMEEKI